MLPIISAEDRLKEKHSAKVGLVGFPGVGKTTQLRTLPAKSTLFVDLEAGDLSVRDWPGDTVRPRTWQEFRDLVVFLAGPMPTATADQAFSQAHYEHVCANYGDPALTVAAGNFDYIGKNLLHKDNFFLEYINLIGIAEPIKHVQVK